MVNELLTLKEYGKAVIYARVSTDEQDKKGFSIIDQKNEGETWASQMGVKIDGMYEDEGYSGTSMNRPNIQKLLKDVSKDKIKLIVVRHSDRLIRDLVLKRSLIKAFNKFDTAIVSLNEDWNSENPEKALFYDLNALLDENEVKKVKPRTIRGLRGSASSGNYAVGGKPPIGYRTEKNIELNKGVKLVICEKEAEMVRKIFHTLASNRVTVVDMVKYLNKNKILGRRWHEKTVFRIIDNPIYYGKFDQKWYQQEEHSPAIVSKETWEEVQRVIHVRKRGCLHFYLFKRLVWCGGCNHPVTLESSSVMVRKKRVTYLYYKCPCCKKRIGESKIKDEFIHRFALHKANVLDVEHIENIKKSIELKKKRINYINKDFDSGLMDEIYYREEVQKLYTALKNMNKEILDFDKQEFDDFVSLSNTQKRAIVLSNIEKIEIKYEEENIKFFYRKSTK